MDKLINENKAREILVNGLSSVELDGKRVLVITPDNTRSGPMPMIFRLFTELLRPRVKELDCLMALGTHQPISKQAKNVLYGITTADRAGIYSGINIYNHHWERPETLKRIGIISSAEMGELSEGRIQEEVPVTLNRLIFDYDHVIIYGPVFPHEVAGFSGGHKYLFPGIAGADIINFTHWLGALITNREIIGRMDTPVRAVIERAAQMVGVPVTGVCSVVEGEAGLAGLFVGPVREAWREAAELSRRTHIRWVDRPYKQVISVMPKMYDDIWTGAKGMYKVEPAVADRGEVIIYAPHIKEVSRTHGKILDEIGYHVRDYFVKQWDRFRRYPGGVLAHSTHLKGMGTFENGVEKPRVKVTLATGIPEERCEKISVGYMDPESLDLKEYEGREDEGILVVHRAGEVLYRLKSQREDKSDE
jgi:nickel-dependent lactate racemase